MKIAAGVAALGVVGGGIALAVTNSSDKEDKPKHAKTSSSISAESESRADTDSNAKDSSTGGDVRKGHNRVLRK